MYLSRRKSDNTVIYEFKEKPVIGKFLKWPIVAIDIGPDTHEIIEVKALVQDYVPGAYQYDEVGMWKVKNQGLVDAFLLEKNKPIPVDKKQEAAADLLRIKAEQEGKALSMSYLDKRLTEIEKILGVI